jgi:hypothetical protein
LSLTPSFQDNYHPHFTYEETEAKIG